METETIADIVREMREMPKDYIVDANANFVFRRYADRIEAAHNYALGEKYAGVVNEREKEIERMRRALKPVLECHLCDGGQQVVSDALCAIREAKEIMKGEMK